MANINQVTKLKGKYCVLSFVDSYDEAGESETIIEAANDEVTIDHQEELLESDNQLGIEITQREVYAGAPTIECGAFLTPDNEIGTEAGIYDNAGNWKTSARNLEAVRIRVYENSELDNLQLVVEGVDVEVQVSDSMSAATDAYFSTTISYHVNEQLNVWTDSNVSVDLNDEFGI